MRTKEILVLLVLLILLQLADAGLTMAGVSRFGTEVEGNFITRQLMGVIGVVPTIVLMKIAVAGILLGLYFLARRRPAAQRSIVRGMWFALGVHVIMVWQWLIALGVV
jgi:hypothetical protein